VAVADFDGDGRLDLAINNSNREPTLYFNELAKDGNWIALKLVGSGSNRSAVGAQVRVRLGDKTLTRQVEAGSGYSAQAMLPVHFGLGQHNTIDEVTIRWPNGHVQQFDGDRWVSDFGLNRLVRITEDTPWTAVGTPASTQAGQLQ
jgi:hypothetical protein